ncbi:T-cell surface glycoprotein CD1a-like [Ochotona princeps]|uniref:T-cell surface glycoprotein CD1a-like n=1 Tax=Ochotona princeps TaxID=9978 RepID=UPI0027144FF3|nr:T-cell surface glycoprotein CD1a-like [Ochotona princeps]
MLYLLVLLAAVFPGRNNEVGFEEPVSFRFIQISSFYNRSWVQNLGSGWLGEWETHRWESNSGSIVFLRPWSRGNFSKEEFMDLEVFLRSHLSRFTRESHKHANQLDFEYPFVLQVVAGCELHSGRDSAGFLREAYQGSDFLAFQNNSWLPSPRGGSRAQHICRLLNLYNSIKKTVHRHLSDTCPRLTLGLLDAGKADLHRQVRPEVWLSRGPSLGPRHLLLVCRVFGFYPKPVRAMWMRDNQELVDSQQGDVLPNADGTWYLRVTLDVAAEEVTGLSCWVNHRSLEGQNIILYWEHHNSISSPFLALLMLLALLMGLMFWIRKHRCQLSVSETKRLNTSMNKFNSNSKNQLVYLE